MGLSCFVHVFAAYLLSGHAFSRPQLQAIEVLMEPIASTSNSSALPEKISSNKRPVKRPLPPVSREEVSPEQSTLPPSTLSQESPKNSIGAAGEVLSATELSASEKYTLQLRNVINRRVEYPSLARRLRQQGQVIVRFLLKKDGSLLEAEIIEPAPYELLNQAVQNLIHEIDGVMPFPEELERETWAFVIPIQYSL